MITEASLEALKARADIVDVVGHFVELKKAGANFKANCPFHDEKSPSFVVSPRKQIYKCFGCGEGGDAIKFVQEYKKLDFVEAVEDIAALLNVRLEYTKESGRGGFEQEILEKMQAFFQASLADAHREYLFSRGVKEESIRRFGIGFAPTTTEQIQYMTRNRLSLSAALEAGILAEDDGRKYARFTKRITFAIRNASGKLVGWSGRLLPGDHRQAKYLNTPGTRLFDKSRVLYGFDTAREAVYAKKRIVLLEGQLDTILCQQEGIATACATLGTALTESHLPQIRRAGAKVLLAYDGDKAGYEAALRAARLLTEHGIEGEAALLPVGEDPADMIASGEKAKLVARLKEGKDVVQFVLQDIMKNFDLSQPYQRAEAAKSCAAFLNTVPDAIVAESYRSYAAQMLGVPRGYFAKSKAMEQPVNYEKGDIGELAIIKSIAENDRLGDIAVDILDEEAMGMRTEYGQVLRRDSESIGAITIRDDIPVYDSETFVKAVKMKQRQFLQNRLRTLSQAKAPVQELVRVRERIKELS